MEECINRKCMYYEKDEENPNSCLTEIDIKICPSYLIENQAHSSVSSSAGLEGLEIDHEMLTRAVKKAVKIGLFPKHQVDADTYLKQRRGMREVLKAALKAA